MISQKLTVYRQCLLRQHGTTWCQWSWIPEQYAVKGKTLRLKQDDGTWDDGWVVETVSDIARNDKERDDRVITEGW